MNFNPLLSISTNFIYLPAPIYQRNKHASNNILHEIHGFFFSAVYVVGPSQLFCITQKLCPSFLVIQAIYITFALFLLFLLLNEEENPCQWSFHLVEIGGGLMLVCLSTFIPQFVRLG